LGAKHLERFNTHFYQGIVTDVSIASSKQDEATQDIINPTAGLQTH
jgi:hypothetical protein